MKNPVLVYSKRGRGASEERRPRDKTLARRHVGLFPLWYRQRRMGRGGSLMGHPVTTNPFIIMLINMTIVFAVLIGLSFMIRLIHLVDPTKEK